jgi:hypothetical protein
MSNRKWAVGKFRAALPITNRLRFGSGVQPLAQSPSRGNSSAAPRMTAGSTSAHGGGT